MMTIKKLDDLRQSIVAESDRNARFRKETRARVRELQGRCAALQDLLEQTVRELAELAESISDE